MPSPTAGSSSDDKVIAALPKGKACLACRKRKVKCDAKSPCTNCFRMGKECIYEEEWERVKRLQGQVNKLEKKLEALQGAPYTDSLVDLKGKGKAFSFGTLDGPSAPLPPYEAPDELAGDWFAQDPLHHNVQMYLFLKSMSLPPKYQPHPALLNVISLVACHHSNDPMLMPYQELFLERTRHHLEESLKNKDRLLNFLSASSVLAYYYLRVGRFLEAAYQISTAARFALACNLHKINNPRWKPPSTIKEDTFTTRLKAGVLKQPMLPPPLDAVDLGERINLFWMIILLDHSASLITGLPSSVDYEEIETVWPRAIEDYESEAACDTVESVKCLFDGDTVMDAALGVPTAPGPDATIKSIVLLERVNQFANIAKGLTIENLQLDLFRLNFEAYQTAIERYNRTIPPLGILQSSGAISPISISVSPRPFSPDGNGTSAASFSSSSPVGLEVPKLTSPSPMPQWFKSILPHTYGLVAYIHLYSSVHRGLDAVECLPGSYHKRLQIAKLVLKDIRDLDTVCVDFTKLLMMQGFAWGAVAHVFAQHMRKQQNESSPDDPLFIEAWQDLTDIVTAIKKMCKVFPILEFQLERLKEYGIPLPLV
ncbi:hypothetical protein FRB96_002068 [Tulasnella sp. 330]|nr:hypothetical protein FRB96_002068 [Tulasnella sp. 330]